ncbi:F21 [Felid gammaherpesvirus 1]|uniref:F21 n=1 Tax=Felid gammaherpesvirus 1 TaxID=2560468 RepID=A0A0M4MPW8_9GAMA|nr:F21 [Felis catus gammaherpesvirus 1]ALE14765.1 F21 [Felis catus gammaherpesvirus 1]
MDLLCNVTLYHTQHIWTVPYLTWVFLLGLQPHSLNVSVQNYNIQIFIVLGDTNNSEVHSVSITKLKQLSQSFTLQSKFIDDCIFTVNLIKLDNHYAILLKASPDMYTSLYAVIIKIEDPFGVVWCQMLPFKPLEKKPYVQILKSVSAPKAILYDKILLTAILKEVPTDLHFNLNVSFDQKHFDNLTLKNFTYITANKLNALILRPQKGISIMFVQTVTNIPTFYKFLSVSIYTDTSKQEYLSECTLKNSKMSKQIPMSNIPGTMVLTYNSSIHKANVLCFDKFDSVFQVKSMIIQTSRKRHKRSSSNSTITPSMSTNTNNSSVTFIDTTSSLASTPTAQTSSLTTTIITANTSSQTSAYAPTTSTQTSSSQTSSSIITSTVTENKSSHSYSTTTNTSHSSMVITENASQITSSVVTPTLTTTQSNTHQTKPLTSSTMNVVIVINMHHINIINL